MVAARAQRPRQRPGPTPRPRFGRRFGVNLGEGAPVYNPASHTVPKMEIVGLIEVY
jgi:hypothetical protein